MKIYPFTFTHFFLFICIICYISCKTGTETKKPSHKILNYTVAQEYKKDNITLTKSLISANTADFLLGYITGIDFTLNNGKITLSKNGEISQISKNAGSELKQFADKIFLIEKGTFQYTPAIINNFKEKYSIKTQTNGRDFWEIYRKLIDTAILTKVKKNGKGKVLPAGLLKVDISDAGLFTISEEMTVYIF